MHLLGCTNKWSAIKIQRSLWLPSLRNDCVCVPIVVDVNTRHSFRSKVCGKRHFVKILWSNGLYCSTGAAIAFIKKKVRRYRTFKLIMLYLLQILLNLLPSWCIWLAYLLPAHTMSGLYSGSNEFSIWEYIGECKIQFAPLTYFIDFTSCYLSMQVTWCYS